MEAKQSNHYCRTGMYLVPSAPMIRKAAANNLASSVLRWGFRVIGASVRIVVLLIVALIVLVAVSTIFVADLHATHRGAARRNKLRKTMRRPHPPMQTQTLELPGY